MYHQRAPRCVGSSDGSGSEQGVRNRWARLPGDAVSEFSTNPVGLITAFEVGLNGVEPGEEEEFDGESMHSYSGDYDLAALLETASEEDREVAEASLELGGGGLEGTPG